ncbi:MAG: hypothetical protein COU63_02430 [Candidatus Pacebacteria bacterium CG10_big_fil_rev_8_21_14_0_10_36_11]|nr:hypothetical protein [Candidatus Pacearchaeota archaeon]OIP73569.1 MAG: hypothetical protein AUK08_03285 [Candidatus Pacebacteria bacterium CG2_30_36_39]PIR64850.1 MAG: hypothetical protein COU63_02430 [Candidatus Pacebacteria bacterium CG10_big_fil_rev_8_21_14_0_10_36_11]PJC42457.1 MAG: hypothetical protein CO040_04345 [Candidatus Pacebacteria bacterium CG_4_9_14_0_2_um_filter_36_8]
MSQKLLEAIEDARMVLSTMRERAKDLGIQGVAEVLTLDLVRELSNISDEEFAELSLFELLSELVGDSDSNSLVAAVLIDVIGKIERRPDKENRGIDDEGTSYGAFATGKLFQSLRTGENSVGDKPVRRGESAARGSAIFRRIATAFSGGSETEDLDVSLMGARAYEGMLIARWQAEFDREYNFPGAKVLGEKADEAAIREQFTVFLRSDEEIVELRLLSGAVVLVQKSI